MGRNLYVKLGQRHYHSSKIRHFVMSTENDKSRLSFWNQSKQIASGNSDDFQLRNTTSIVKAPAKAADNSKEDDKALVKAADNSKEDDKVPVKAADISKQEMKVPVKSNVTQEKKSHEVETKVYPSNTDVSTINEKKDDDEALVNSKDDYNALVKAADIPKQEMKVPVKSNVTPEKKSHEVETDKILCPINRSDASTNTPDKSKHL